MVRIVQRLVRPTMLAALLVALLAATALAWTATCSSARACVWKNANFEVPLAATSGADDNYTNDKYPNTQDSLHDSVSSIKNTFSSYDIVWFFNESYSGTSFCLNAGWQSGQLNSHNDQDDSHLIATGSTC